MRSINETVVFALLAAGAAACSLVGLDDDAPSIPSEVVHEGLLFRLEPSEYSEDRAGSGWIDALSLSATNQTNTAFRREWEFCVFSGQVAYREGEWREPVWRESEVPFLGVCSGTTQNPLFEPGETVQPDQWTQQYAVDWILGDSLDPGLYRFGADVMVEFRRPLDESVRIHMVAAEPIFLE